MTEFNDINLPADFDDLSKHAPLLDQLRAKGDGVPNEDSSQWGLVVPSGYFEESLENAVAGCRLSVIGHNDSAFTVPENYFEELAERIIAVVTLSIADSKQTATDNSFGVPENYFDELTDQIISIVALHAADSRQQVTDNSFEVPEGYFNELDETLRTNLALDNLKQDEGFGVPESYFEKLSGKIISHIAVGELNGDAEENIPPGYFDTLADRIATRIAEEENIATEKVAERGRVLVFAEVLKRYSRPLSIAASLTLLISVSIWFFNRGNGIQTDSIAKYVPSGGKFTPIVPALQLPYFVATPKNETIASIVPTRRKPTHPLNPQQENAVKEQTAAVMNQVDQIDENTIADYLQDNSEITPIQVEAPDKKSISDYIIDSNIDANDLINGINNQTP